MFSQQYWAIQYFSARYWVDFNFIIIVPHPFVVVSDTLNINTVLVYPLVVTGELVI